MRLNADEMETLVRRIVSSQTEATLEPINADSLVEYWRKMMVTGTGVAYGSEAGFLLGVHTVDVMTGKRKAFEYLWLLHPDKREGRAALALLDEFESGAAQDGCVSVIAGNSAGWKPDVMARLYRRLGYAPISASFQKYL